MALEGLSSWWQNWRRPATTGAAGLAGEAPEPIALQADPLEALHTLGSHSEVRGTSFNLKQNEVVNMVEATRENHWPGFWYELLQGAYEYNDWSKGLPQVLIYYPGDSTPVTLTKFAKDWRYFFRRPVDRVEVRNYIRGGAGLRPLNVAATYHEEKDEQVGLSQHGRGMKISSTAAMGALAQGVSFQSWLPKLGAWYGVGELKREADDPIDTFQLRYNKNAQLQLEETVISIHKPTRAALKALADLPKWFLPTNAKYEHYRLNAERDQVLPAQFALYANPVRAGEISARRQAFQPREVEQFGGAALATETNRLEPARVEVLPPEMFGRQKGPIDFVFVDGLRVKVPGANLAHIYAFYGWRDCAYGYNPSRSNDSLRLADSMDQLLMTVFTKCTEPTVFLRLLRKNIGKQSTYEGTDARRTSFSMEDSAKQALKQAWETFLKELGVGEPILLTNDQILHQAAKKSKSRSETLLCFSENIVRLLREAMPELQMLEVVLQQEAQLAKIREAEHQKQMAELAAIMEAETKAALAAAALQAENEKKELEARLLREQGYLTRAVSSKEKLLVAAPESTSVSLELARLHILNLVALNNGSIRTETPFGQPRLMIVELRIPEMTQLPRNIQDMGQIRDLLLTFLGATAQEASVEARFVVNGEGVYFRLGRMTEPADEMGNYELWTHHGKLNMDDSRLVRLTFTFPPMANDQHFIADTTALIDRFRTPAGDFDTDAYLISQEFQEFPLSEEALKQKRAATERMRKLRETLRKENALRIQLGLAPIPDPYMDTYDPATLGKPEELPEQKPQQPTKDTQKAIERGEQLTFGDAPIFDALLRLLHPDATPGISTHGKAERLRIIDASEDPIDRIRNQSERRILELFKRKVAPDCSIASGEFGRVRPYLIASIDEDPGTRAYTKLSGFEFGKRGGLAKLRFNKPIDAGIGVIPCPPGYRPTAYFHPEGEIPGIQLTGNLEHNTFAVHSRTRIEKGLVVYFTKQQSFVDRSEPIPANTRERLNWNTLSPEWKSLLEALRDSPLSAKQKIDVIIRAWSQRGFVYDDSDECFAQYRGIDQDSPEFGSAVLSHGNGDCGYAMRGFTAATSAMRLLSAVGNDVGIPVREVTAYLAGPNGNFSLRGNLHGMVQVYLDRRWVLIEPQVGYIEPGYDLEEIPSQYRTQFEGLIRAIPVGQTASPERMLDVPAELGEEMEDFNTMIEELREMYQSFFGENDRLSLQDVVALFTTSIDTYGKRRFALKAAKLGALVVSGKLALELARPYIPELVQAVSQVLGAIPPEVMETIIRGIILLAFPASYVLAGGAGYGIGSFATERKIASQLRAREQTLAPSNQNNQQHQPEGTGGDLAPLPLAVD